MHWTVVSQVWQTGRAVARRCDKLATAGGDGNRHVGITPVRIIGVLVSEMHTTHQQAEQDLEMSTMQAWKTNKQQQSNYRQLSTYHYLFIN